MSDVELLSSLLLFVFCVVAGSLIQWLVSKLNKWVRLPVSVWWFLFGALVCVLELVCVRSTTVTDPTTHQTEHVIYMGDDDYNNVNLLSIGLAEGSRLPHNALYFIVLPLLLYDATQQVDWYHFRKNLRGGCLLAIIGVVLQVFIIGLLIKPIGLTFKSSFMIAATVGATDPVAVLSVLEEMDSPASLSSLFDCESLINDGSAVFLFTFFKSLNSSHTATLPPSTQFKEASKEFFQLLLIGPLFGLGLACCLYRFIRHFRFYVHDVTLLIIGIAFLVFFVSEIYFHTSGPLAIVVFGLYFKAYGISGLDSQAEKVHRQFLKGLGVAFTSFVFIVSGMTCARIFYDAIRETESLVINYQAITSASRTDTMKDVGFGASELWQIPVFYLICHLARGIMVILFAPMLKHDMGNAFTWKEGVLLWWGGLRGGVCLIIALMIEQDSTIPPHLSSRAALYLASTTFLVLCVNGSTFNLLYKWLQPYHQNPFKALYLLKVLSYIDAEFEQEVTLLKDHWLFSNNNALTFSKSLIPRLSSLSVSSSNGINFPSVPVRRAFKVMDLSLFKIHNGNLQAAPSESDEPIPVDDKSRSGLDAGSYNVDGQLAAARVENLLRQQDRDISRAMVNLDLGFCDQEPDCPEQSVHDEVAEYSSVTSSLSSVPASLPAAATAHRDLDSQLSEPLLSNDDMVISKQPLYQVAAYSGGFTYRTRYERRHPAVQREAETELPKSFMKNDRSSRSSSFALLQNSWSAHFLQGSKKLQSDVLPPASVSVTSSPLTPLCCNILSPNATIKIKDVRPWEKEGEVSIMVINSSRHLYRRMYEQAFISGSNYMALMSIGDVVNDFCTTRGLCDRSKEKAWLTMIRKTSVVEQRLLAQGDILLTMSNRLSDRLSPFDLQWALLCRSLHMCSSSWEVPVYHHLRQRRIWSGRLRRVLVWCWHFIGPRQTFPALDDLQALCGFVDVHEEMLRRGHQGLKFILGKHLLESYRERVRLSRLAASICLTTAYPVSYKHALICHGGIFLVNLKIQLVEEYLERGLLMSNDADAILTTLKRQLVKIMKYHPEHIFS